MILFGTRIGSLLPFALFGVGFDPASVSALFVVTLVDMTGLVIYFTVASVVLHGTLFNDGTVIVVFGLVLAAVPAGAVGGHGGLEPLAATIDFLHVSAVSLTLGAGLGWLVALAIARIDDYLIETTLTTVLAFGAFLLAERVHVGGVLAVGAAGSSAATSAGRGCRRRPGSSSATSGRTWPSSPTR